MPTALERRHLARHPRLGLDHRCELCGFGPVAAAARAAALVARHHPPRVLLIGIGGTYAPATLPVGTAAVFDRVRMHGVGIQAGETFVPASAIGIPQWPAAGEASIGDELTLTTPIPAAGGLLTCGAASASAAEARRRRHQFPGSVAEDMEGFAVALACRLAGVPLAIVRGISNLVGDRETETWQIPEALDAAGQVAAALLERSSWGPDA